ncbi:MAG: type I-C CRISPR-associated protein Cas8c/Csd1 [Lentimicrobium sp.]|jgi:CRISPR-associated protein Csd1|nr:type I-C CRISPR-associated protein Cas8c/Csd1 [Lentimicrobium sp.]
MILQALYNYYQRKEADPESNIAPMGFEWKEIPFIIVIDTEGHFFNLEDTRVGEGKVKRGKSFLVIKTKSRPGSRASETANVFWDHWGFVLGQPKEKDDKKTLLQLQEDAKKQNLTFVAQVKHLSEKYSDNMQFQAVYKFYEQSHQLEKLLCHESWKDCYKIPGCNLSFRISGEISIVAEHHDLINEIEVNDGKIKNEGVLVPDSICLITGERSSIAVLHSATPIQGGKSGAKLVGFQKNSGYDSYYKEQGFNAPISKKAEDAYTTALNVLLGKDSKNKFRISDTSIVFWAHQHIDFENQFSFFFNAPDKDDPDRNIQEIKALFESIHTGKLNTDGDIPFYILGLAPNAARISIRFWKTGKVIDFAAHISKHFDDFDIIRGKNDEKEYFTIFNLISNISFEYNIDNAPPNLTGKVIESILDGTKYPDTLQQQCIRRIRAEQHISRIRAAILKAYLNRKNEINNSTNEKPITMALDLDNRNQGYLCGRLFAVLEKIQEDAQPGINATIKDRYYGAASSTPITVFGRLLNLTNHHLTKLGGGSKTYYEKMIQEIMSSVKSDGLPTHLSLDDQSRFAIGYYHQRQDLYTKKDKNN